MFHHRVKTTLPFRWRTPLLLCLVFALTLPSPAQTWISTSTQGLGTVLTNAVQLGPLPASTTLHIAVALKLNNRDSLIQYVKAINDPGSPLYGSSLTVSQFVAAYAPTSSQVQPVVNYLAAQGFNNIQVEPNNLFVTADGTVAEIGAAFFTSIIQFQQNDYFKVSFGRYHTPINYWNETFHHGQWLQTSISRPEMVQFGGSFLPIHFVGALVEGAAPAGGLNVNYNFGLGNGRSGVISKAGDWGDVNNNRAWLVNLFSRPSALYGLQFGGSVYRDLITPVGSLAGSAFHEWIQSAHVVWSKENPELIAEFANVTHQQVGGSLKSNSQAWYVQTAYRLPGSARLWKPYYRFEYIHIPGSDKLFKAVPSLAGSTVGVRYDISSFAALKFEWRNLRRPNEPRVNGAFAQTSFTF